MINRNGRRAVVCHIGSPRQELCANLARETLPEKGGTIDEQSDFMLRLALAEENMPATAWLLLGRRPDGTPCNRDERRSLEELAVQLAGPIVTTEVRDMRDKKLARLMAKHDKRLSAIEATLRSAG